VNYVTFSKNYITFFQIDYIIFVLVVKLKIGAKMENLINPNWTIDEDEPFVFPSKENQNWYSANMIISGNGPQKPSSDDMEQQDKFEG